MSHTTLTIAAQTLLKKAWNMLPRSRRVDMIYHISTNNMFSHICLAFSAMLSASGHRSNVDSVEIFLVEAFQSNDFDDIAHHFISCQDEEFEDSHDKHLDYIAAHPNKH